MMKLNNKVRFKVIKKVYNEACWFIVNYDKVHEKADNEIYHKVRDEIYTKVMVEVTVIFRYKIYHKSWKC